MQGIREVQVAVTDERQHHALALHERRRALDALKDCRIVRLRTQHNSMHKSRALEMCCLPWLMSISTGPSSAR